MSWHLMIVAMLTILAVWLWLWLVFLGWGTLACKAARCDRQDLTSLLVTPWIGVACVLALLQIWHLAAPIDSWPFVIVSSIGLLSTAAFCRTQLVNFVSTARSNPGMAALTTLVIVWIANRSLNTQEYTDHGLYYMNAIRWATDYRIVPGLANLHHRLAFNNSIFLLHAMLEFGGWRDYTAHLVNGFLAAMTVPMIVRGYSAVVYRSGREQQFGWFAVALAMIVALSAADRRISAAHPDFAAAMLVTVAAWRLLAILLLDGESEGKPFRFNLLAIAFLATAAVTIKTTVIFFAGFAAAALVVCLYKLEKRRGSHPVRATLSQLAFMLPSVAVLFVPWVIRGYILSGYPLFPGTVGGLPVDWAYPASYAAQLRSVIYAWSRTDYLAPELGLQPGWGWVPVWIVQIALLRGPIEMVVPIITSLVCFAVLAWSKFRSLDSAERLGGSQLSVWPLVVAYVCSILAWFFTGPSGRMGSFALWGLAATLLGLVSQTFSADFFRRYRRLILTGLIVLLLLPMADEALRIEVRYRKNPKMPEFGERAYQYFPFVLPTWDGNFPPVPRGRLIEQSSRHGVVVHVGEMTPKGIPDLVWDSPLPATQYLNPHLEFRRPGDLQAGFRTTNPAGTSDETTKGLW